MRNLGPGSYDLPTAFNSDFKKIKKPQKYRS